MMVPVRSPAAGLSIAQDAADGSWTISCAEPPQEHRLRPWRWGERRRIVQAASRDGYFDSPRFIAGVIGTLYDPPPPPELVPLYALLALDLLGLGRGPAPRPLGQAEAQLAARFGWLPSTIAEESAPALDGLLATLEPAQEPTSDKGWSTIQIADSDDG
jgi:hypothetical protein